MELRDMDVDVLLFELFSKIKFWTGPDIMIEEKISICVLINVAFMLIFERLVRVIFWLFSWQCSKKTDRNRVLPKKKMMFKVSTVGVKRVVSQKTPMNLELKQVLLLGLWQ